MLRSVAVALDSVIQDISKTYEGVSVVVRQLDDTIAHLKDDAGELGRMLAYGSALWPCLAALG